MKRIFYLSILAESALMAWNVWIVMDKLATGKPEVWLILNITAMIYVFFLALDIVIKNND